MPQFAQGFGFDLADAFAGDRKRLADLFERVLGAVFQAEAHLDDLFLARGERAQHLRRLVFQVHVDHGLSGRDHGAVFNEVAQVRIFFFADGRLQRDGLLRDLENFPDFCDRDVHALGDLFRSWLAAELLHQLPRGADQLVDGFDHVHRNADGAGLIGDGARDGLADPPRGVRREFVAAAVLELVHRLHQADVAFLNQVEELEPAVGVFFGDRDHQAQVGLDELALGGFGVDVALDDLALRALELLVADAGVAFEFFQIVAVLALDAAVLALGLFDPRRLDLLFQIVDLAVERAHGVDGLVDLFDQALALRVGEFEPADPHGDHHLRAAQMPARAAELLGFFLLLDCLELFRELLDFFVVLADVVDLAGEVFQARLHDFVGDLLFVEGDQLFDGAHAALQVLTQREDFLDDDRRTGKSFEHADLPALDALCNFYFTFAREQRNRAHLAQVHAYRVVGLFQSARGEIEFYVFAFLQIFKLLFGRQSFSCIQDINALGPNRREQVIQIIWGVDITGY